MEFLIYILTFLAQFLFSYQRSSLWLNDADTPSTVLLSAVLGVLQGSQAAPRGRAVAPQYHNR